MVGIEEEWRFVVVDGVVIAGSSYAAVDRAAGTALTSDSEAWGHAQLLSERLDDVDPAYVLDVCRTADGLRLLELNPFSGADLYACDRRAVVATVNALLEL